MHAVKLRRGGVTLPGFLTYGSYRVLGALTGPLPQNIGYGLARRVGPLLYALSPRLRHILSHNMRHVLGPDADEQDVQDTVRAACVNIAKGHYDLFRLGRLTLDEIKSMTRIEGVENMYQALAREKGIVMVTAHFGTIDIMGQLPSYFGVPVSGPVEHTRPERLFQYTLRLRKSHGVRLIPSDGSMMELFRALKRGEIVGLPTDKGIADNTHEIEFFGSPARLPFGPVRLALRTGAALVPAFALRLPDDTFNVCIEPELELQQSGDREADAFAGMTKIVAIMERYISQNPEQWLVAAPVWPMN
jgi:lauroyl/myristoyl acyltransferase